MSIKIQTENYFSAQKIVNDSDNIEVYLNNGDVVFNTHNRLRIKPTTIKPKTAYTFKLIVHSNVNTVNNVKYIINYTDGTTQVVEGTGEIYDTNNKTTIFSTNANKTLNYVSDMYTYGKSATIVTNGSVIVEGSYTAETMPPYYEQNLPFTLGNINLNKINTSQDYFYRTNNKWYKHEEIGSMTLTSALDWQTSEITTQVETIAFSTIINLNMYSSHLILCNYFEQHNRDATIDIPLIDNSNENGNRIWIKINRTDLVTEDVQGFKTWLDNHDVKICVPIISTDIEITDTTLKAQLDATLNAISYNEQTNISSTSTDLSADLEAEAFERMSNQNYVTQEIPIGMWQGKTLYRKVIDIGVLPNSTTKVVSHYISNIDYIKSCTGYAMTSQGAGMNCPSNDVDFYCSTVAITVTTTADKSSFTTCFATIEYTKTTD